MLHLVSGDGRYHGDVQSIEEARAHVAKQKMSGVRAVSDAEWQQIIQSGDQRAALCARLGTEI